MALVPRLPRDPRLPVVFLTRRNPAYNRPALEAFSPRHFTPLLPLLQTRTATGYTGARKPHNLWKQPAVVTGASQSSEDSTDNKRRNSKNGKSKKSQKPKPERVSHRGGSGPHSKPHGAERDSTEVKLSKTLSWILRHGAAFEGLAMREDGFVYVSDIVCISVS
jgi:2'-phosphotransferase